MRRIQKFSLLVLAILSIALTSCAVTLNGRPVINVPQYFSDTWVEFCGIDDPCRRLAVVPENLGEGASVQLWKNFGEFNLHANGLVVSASYTYTGANNGRTVPIRLPGSTWVVPNFQDNSTRTMTVTVLYQNEGQPQRPWTGVYSIYNSNLRELCPDQHQGQVRRW